MGLLLRVCLEHLGRDSKHTVLERGLCRSEKGYCLSGKGWLMFELKKKKKKKKKKEKKTKKKKLKITLQIKHRHRNGLRKADWESYEVKSLICNWPQVVIVGK